MPLRLIVWLHVGASFALLHAVIVCSAGEPRGNCPTITPGAMPAPNGSFIRQWQQRQIAKAAMDRFVIYRHEWHGDGTAPGPYGKYHLEQIAQALPGVPFQVVIQPDPIEHKNVFRRQEVVNYLLAHGVTDAAERVVVGYPRAEGLYGDEAFRVYRGILQGGFGGGFGGGGLGGGLGLGSFGGVGGAGSGMGGLGGGIRGY